MRDLDRLTARLPESDARLFDDIDLPDLSRWAIEGRYPGDLDEASSAQAERAIVIAAELVGTTQSAIARLEGGRISPSLPTLDRIAKALGAELTVTLTDLHDLIGAR